MQNISAYIPGLPATKTGEYYSQVYSEIDSNTGVPVLGVELQDGKNLKDIQVLDLELLELKEQPLELNTINLDNTDNPATTAEESYSGFGIFILVILMFIIAFVYFIVRLWQDHQIQKDAIKVMHNDALGTKSAEETVSEPTIALSDNSFSPIEALAVSDSAVDRRQALELADKMLRGLLDASNIAGDTISDKLKIVSAGEFASIDIAWEAHQSARQLLTAQDSDITIDKVHRVISLYKQVFAEHGII